MGTWQRGSSLFPGGQTKVLYVVGENDQSGTAAPAGTVLDAEIYGTDGNGTIQGRVICPDISEGILPLTQGTFTNAAAAVAAYQGSGDTSGLGFFYLS